MAKKAERSRSGDSAQDTQPGDQAPEATRGVPPEVQLAWARILSAASQNAEFAQTAFADVTAAFAEQGIADITGINLETELVPAFSDAQRMVSGALAMRAQEQAAGGFFASGSASRGPEASQTAIPEDTGQTPEPSRNEDQNLGGMNMYQTASQGTYMGGCLGTFGTAGSIGTVGGTAGSAATVGSYGSAGAMEQMGPVASMLTQQTFGSLKPTLQTFASMKATIPTQGSLVSQPPLQSTRLSGGSYGDSMMGGCWGSAGTIGSAGTFGGCAGTVGTGACYGCAGDDKLSFCEPCSASIPTQQTTGSLSIPTQQTVASVKATIPTQPTVATRQTQPTIASIQTQPTIASIQTQPTAATIKTTGSLVSQPGPMPAGDPMAGGCNGTFGTVGSLGTIGGTAGSAATVGTYGSAGVVAELQTDRFTMAPRATIQMTMQTVALTQGSFARPMADLQSTRLSGATMGSFATYCGCVADTQGATDPLSGGCWGSAGTIGSAGTFGGCAGTVGTGACYGCAGDSMQALSAVRINPISVAPALEKNRISALQPMGGGAASYGSYATAGCWG